MWIIIAAIFFFSVSVSAFDASDFANNAVSDLGPLIALFGEQVTTQFLRSSFSIFDNVLFAMAPVGILTVISAAIRVGGISLLKTLIGRAGESRESVEIELLSSTSKDVSEIWNGRELVRVSGEGDVLEIVYRDQSPTANNCLTLADAVRYVEERICSSSDLISSKIQTGINLISVDEEKAPSGAAVHAEVKNRPAPNISLNFQDPTWYSSAMGQGRPMKIVATWAACAVVLQLGVLIYFCVVTFTLKLSAGDDSPSPNVGFGLTFSGTLLLVIGMFICASIIEQSSDEDKLVVKEDKEGAKGDQFQLLWIQNRGRVSDEYSSWVIFADRPHRVLLISSRASEEKFKGIVLVGTGIATCGFIMQLFGVRMMHWSAAVAQFASVVIATGMRALSKIHLSNHPESWKIRDHYELDWVAMRFEGNPKEGHSLFKLKQSDVRCGCEPQNGCKFRGEGSWNWCVETGTVGQDGEGLVSVESQVCTDSHFVLKVRERLGSLSKPIGSKWAGPATKIAVSLAKAIDDILNSPLLSTTSFLSPLKDEEKFWSMRVFNAVKGETQKVYFKLKWEERGWRSSADELEAFLSLWLFELNSTFDTEDSAESRPEDSSHEGDHKVIRRLGEWSLKTDMLRWGGEAAETMLKIIESQQAAVTEKGGWNSERFHSSRMFGFQKSQTGIGDSTEMQVFRTKLLGNDEAGYASSGQEVEEEAEHRSEWHLAMVLDASLPEICAHEILAQFLNTTLSALSDGDIEKMESSTTFQPHGAPRLRPNIGLKNSMMTDIAQRVKESGVTSFEHAMLYTVAALSQAGKMPDTQAVLEFARTRVQPNASNLDQLNEVLDTCKWLIREYGTSRRIGREVCILAVVLREQLNAIIGIMKTEVAPMGIGSVESARLQIDAAIEEAPHGIISDLEELYKLHPRGKVGRDELQRLLRNYQTPLALWTRPILDWLFQRGTADLVTMTDDFGWSVVQYFVVYFGQNTELEDYNLFKNMFPPAMINGKDRFGRTPLHEAASRGLVNVAMNIIYCTPEIDAQDDQGMTAFHLAAQYGHLDVAKVLIEAGANLNSLDYSHKSVLHWLCHAPEDERRGKTEDQLALEFKPLEALFQHAIHVRDSNGRTALQLAAEIGPDNRNKTFIKKLIASDDSPDMANSEGISPLHLAAHNGDDTMVDLLLSKRADVDAVSRIGWTALHYAVSRGKSSVVNALLMGGADINLRGTDGTALELAVKAQEDDIAWQLVNRAFQDRFSNINALLDS